MRGKSCGLHPQALMGKRSSPCGRTDKAVYVEDHGNGYMFVGCADIDQARRILDRDYVDNADEYRFAAHLWYEDRVCAVWLSDEPFAAWEGATDYAGQPLPR